MAIPEDHKEYFKGVVEKHIEEYQEQMVKHSKSLRLLDGTETEPEYSVIIISHWEVDGEKNVELTQKGRLGMS